MKGKTKTARIKKQPMITLLDYGAGNVRSVINAIETLGEKIHIVKTEMISFLPKNWSSPVLAPSVT